MARRREDGFEQIVPGAADMSGKFLGVLQRRCKQEGLDLELHVHEARRSKRLTLRAPILMKRSRPLELEVFADPVGNALQVGWLLSRQVAHPLMEAMSDNISGGQAVMDIMESSMSIQNDLNRLLNAFHELVFIPVLNQLVDAVQRTRGLESGGSGFLGV